MKNEQFNFWLICLAYFIIGLMIANNYVHHQNLKSIQKSVDTLIKIEMITEQQFNILQGKLNDLERDFYRIPRDSRIANTR
jgi:hypothetical protein